MRDIEKQCRAVLERIPPHVTLVAAAKTRSVEEIQAAARAGITDFGHNYLQEAERMTGDLPDSIRWHMIGHLQKNKAKKAVALFDMIETVDSFDLAQIISRRCASIDKTMPVLVEVNSGREANKAGVLPEDLEELIRRVAELPNLSVQGLMTMGPAFGDPEDARPCFKATRVAFDRLADVDIPNIQMKHLSMGMSNSYQTAIEEGGNMVRVGTALFGPRPI